MGGAQWRNLLLFPAGRRRRGAAHAFTHRRCPREEKLEVSPLRSAHWPACASVEMTVVSRQRQLGVTKCSRTRLGTGTPAARKYPVEASFTMSCNSRKSSPCVVMPPRPDGSSQDATNKEESSSPSTIKVISGSGFMVRRIATAGGGRKRLCGLVPLRDVAATGAESFFENEIQRRAVIATVRRFRDEDFDGRSFRQLNFAEGAKDAVFVDGGDRFQARELTQAFTASQSPLAEHPLSASR